MTQKKAGIAKRMFDWWDEHAKMQYSITIGMIASSILVLALVIPATQQIFTKNPEEPALGVLYFILALAFSALLFFSGLLIQMLLSRTDKKEIVKEIQDGNKAIVKEIQDGNKAIVKEIQDGNKARTDKMNELIDVIKKKS